MGMESRTLSPTSLFDWIDLGGSLPFGVFASRILAIGSLIRPSRKT